MARPPKRGRRFRRSWADESLGLITGEQGLPRKRKARPVLVTERDEALLRRLVKLLRQNAGVPVRTPAHRDPPFRSQPFAFGQHANVNGPGAGVASRTRFGVRWTAADDGINLYGPKNSFRTPGTFFAAEPFPEGQLGVVQSVQCWAYQLSSFVAVDLVREAKWSVLLNGSYVPGYQWQFPSGTLFNSVLNTPDTFATISTPLETPLRLRPGDRIEGELGADDINAGVTISFVWLLRGYSYPASGSDGTVYDTLVD